MIEVLEQNETVERADPLFSLTEILDKIGLEVNFKRFCNSKLGKLCSIKDAGELYNELSIVRASLEEKKENETKTNAMTNSEKKLLSLIIDLMSFLTTYYEDFMFYLNLENKNRPSFFHFKQYIDYKKKDYSIIKAPELKNLYNLMNMPILRDGNITQIIEVQKLGVSAEQLENTIMIIDYLRSAKGFTQDHYEHRVAELITKLKENGYTFDESNPIVVIDAYPHLFPNYCESKIFNDNIELYNYFLSLANLEYVDWSEFQNNLKLIKFQNLLPEEKNAIQSQFQTILNTYYHRLINGNGTISLGQYIELYSNIKNVDEGINIVLGDLGEIIDNCKLEGSDINYLLQLTNADIIRTYPKLKEKVFKGIIKQDDYTKCINFSRFYRDTTDNHVIYTSKSFDILNILSNLLTGSPGHKIDLKIQDSIVKIVEQIKMWIDGLRTEVIDNENSSSFDYLSEIFMSLYRLKVSCQGFVKIKIDELYSNYEKKLIDFSDTYSARVNQLIGITNNQGKHGKELQEEMPDLIDRIEQVTTINEQNFEKLGLSINEKITFRDDGSNGKYILSVNKNGIQGEWEIIAEEGGFFQAIVLRNLNNEDMIIRVDEGSFIEAYGKQNLSEFIHTAESRYEKEIEGANTLGAYDLPKVEGIGYYKMIDGEFDTVVGLKIAHSIQLQNKLQKKYPNIRNVGENYTLRPKEDLEKKVKECIANGINFMYIDIITHGTEKGFNFGDANLSTNDIIEIAKKYPTMKFCISSTACYGGRFGTDLYNLMQKDENKTLKTRITAFLQTQGDALNYTAQFDNQGLKKLTNPKGNLNYSTNYNLYLYEGLDKFDTYGEAVQYASNQVKKTQLLDAEGIINGEIVSTGKINQHIKIG